MTARPGQLTPAPAPGPLLQEQLPYWKQRGSGGGRGDGGAEAARLRKQLAELSKDFAALLKAHERGDAALQDVQGKIKLLRQEAAAKDKQLDLCRRTIERLAVEKTQREARQGRAGLSVGSCGPEPALQARRACNSDDWQTERRRLRVPNWRCVFAPAQAAAAADKAYIRRLESRLLSVKDAVETQLQAAEFKAQVGGRAAAQR